MSHIMNKLIAEKYAKELHEAIDEFILKFNQNSDYDVSAQQENIGSHVFLGQCGKRKASITAKTLQANMLEF